MHRRPNARDLLRCAAQIYDADADLREAARRAWQRGFASGGEWMALAMSRVNERSGGATATFRLHQLGFIKYGMAAMAASFAILGAAMLGHRMVGLPLAVLAFYLVEVQMLFLFPTALTGSAKPFRDALRCTRRAGGTIRTLPVVLVLAAVMLFGGLAGRGFLRCWCLGCLSVCVWYDMLQHCDTA